MEEPGRGTNLFLHDLDTRPNEVVAAVHDRKPVILEKEAAWSWLQSGQPVAHLLTLLGLFPAAQMAEHRVSREVNQTVFDSSLMIAPDWGTSTLFLPVSFAKNKSQA